MVIRRRFITGFLYAAMFVFVILCYRIATLSFSGSFLEPSYAKSAPALLRNIHEHDKTGSAVPTSLQTSGHALKRPSQTASLKALNGTYRRAMVVARMQEDDIAWMSENLPGIDFNVYIANDAKAQLHPPKNKGHEVMIYLTFIIDHYEQLPDIVLFMHAHRFTHHNSEIFGFDAIPMIERLSNEYVIRQGYVNMRCDWSPGCPQGLRPGAPHEALDKQEEVVLSRCWYELFPNDSLPETIAQACCAQFAVSKERLQSIPKSRYVFYRDWMMRTPLSDYISGRIWEYSWQLLFTNQTVFCPDEYTCYCDGFGICFGGQQRYNDYKMLRHTKQEYENELKELMETHSSSKGMEEDKDTADGLAGSDAGRIQGLEHQIDALGKELIAWETEAMAREAVDEAK